jgi:hypothetical protein
MSATLDLLLSSTIVALALAFLVLRFVRPRNKQVSGPADVVVGASLQRGLEKARSRRGARGKAR